MKCLENVEKLNYNYQVLKRREEENACAKADQRKKINKYYTFIHQLIKAFIDSYFIL